MVVESNPGEPAQAAAKGAGAVAQLGSLDPEVASDLSLLRDFINNRQRHLVRLLGRSLKYSPLRDELLRLILIEFGADRYGRVSAYVRACGAYGTEPSVRAEIDVLQSAGLVILTRDPAHPRAFLVKPTEKLVRFYNEQMPRVRSEALRLLL